MDRDVRCTRGEENSMIGIEAKMGGDGHELAFFEMSFCPSLELVSLVRRFVGTFYLRVLSDPDLASRVALATHELLENAVKYSTDGETNIRMEIKKQGTGHQIEIRTRNRTATDQLEKLASNVDEMNQLNDPFKYYQQLMRRSAKRGITGGLGLGRIAAESEMQITLEVTGDVVEVFARTMPIVEAA
jgi:hypothetical protein